MNSLRAFFTTSASPKSMCFISSICDSFSASHLDSLLSSSLYSCQLFNTSCSMVHLGFKITNTQRKISIVYQNQAGDERLCPVSEKDQFNKRTKTPIEDGARIKNAQIWVFAIRAPSLNGVSILLLNQPKSLRRPISRSSVPLDQHQEIFKHAQWGDIYSPLLCPLAHI